MKETNEMIKTVIKVVMVIDAIYFAFSGFMLIWGLFTFVSIFRLMLYVAGMMLAVIFIIILKILLNNFNTR